MNINDFKGRNSYVLLSVKDSGVPNLVFPATAVEDVMNAYSRIADQRGWKADQLDVWISWERSCLTHTLWVRGWESYGVLLEDQDLHCRQYARPDGRGRAVEVCVSVYVVPEASEYEWQPFLDEVHEEVFYTFESAGGKPPVAAGIRLHHKPTGSGTDCREVIPVYAPGLRQYTLECNRKAAWSFLLDRLRTLGYEAGNR